MVRVIRIILFSEPIVLIYDATGTVISLLFIFLTLGVSTFREETRSSVLTYIYFLRSSRKVECPSIGGVILYTRTVSFVLELHKHERLM